MEIVRLPVGSLETNCYIIAVDNSAAVIDPGGDPDVIISELEKRNLNVGLILNTHGHHDHVLANSEIAKYAGKIVYIHPADEFFLSDGQGFLGLPVAEKDYQTSALEDGQTLDLADNKIQVIHTPGHTPGSISFLISGNLFCGDLIFKQSIGRTDLEGSSPEEMIKSLQKIMKLDKGTVVYPGHGLQTTIGAEVHNNPFLLELNL